MRKVTVKIPESLFEKLEELVKKGEYASISEAVRSILRQYLEKEGSGDDDKV